EPGGKPRRSDRIENDQAGEERYVRRATADRHLRRNVAGGEEDSGSQSPPGTTADHPRKPDQHNRGDRRGDQPDADPHVARHRPLAVATEQADTEQSQSNHRQERANPLTATERHTRETRDHDREDFRYRQRRFPPPATTPPHRA